MKEVTKKEDFDGIIVLDDVISEELTDKLVDYISNLKDDELKTESYGPTSNVNCKYIGLLEIKDKKTRDELDSGVFEVVGNIIKYLKKEYEFEGGQDSGYQLRKIYGPTRQHVDGPFTHPKSLTPSSIITVDAVRTGSLIISLNDDYKGGEFKFPYQKKTFRLKKRQAVIFPPYWTHPHSVSSPTEKTLRYTINTWITGM
tara:strand:- start:455 stop:1054 length:600 start_codon:yes stop_codon:yes gene_type:complete